MKFKKFLALSLAAAMMTTGIPGVGMLDGAVNVMVAAATIIGASWTINSTKDISDDEDGVKIANISCSDSDVVIDKKNNQFIYKGAATPTANTFTIGGLQTDDYSATLNSEGDKIIFTSSSSGTNTLSDGKTISFKIITVTSDGAGTFKDSSGVDHNVVIDFKDGSGTELGTLTKYTGEDVKPTLNNTVVTLDDAVLNNKTDYTISYYKANKNGANATVGDKVDKIVDAGWYYVAVTAKNGYSGTIYSTFEVQTIVLGTDYMISSGVTVDSNSVGYTGKDIVPTVKKVTVNNKVLSTDDYSVSYDAGVDSVSPGVKNLVITGKGNYSGSVTTSATTDGSLLVNKAVTKDDVTFYQDKTGTENALVVSGIYLLSAGTDYSYNSGDSYINMIAGSGYVCNSGNNVEGNRMQYKAGAIAEAKDFSEGSNNFEVVVSSVAEYTGKEVKPTVVVRDSSKNVIDPSNYKVVYANNISVAESNDPTAPTVYVIGQNDYCGMMSENFSIVSQNMKGGSIDTIKSSVYTGSSLALADTDITVRDSSGNILKDSDYDIVGYHKVSVDSDGELISDENGILGYDTTVASEVKNAGTYIVDVKLAGNYSNSAEHLYQVYKVTPASITSGYQFTMGINADKNDFKVAYTGDIIQTYNLSNPKLVALDEDGNPTTDVIYGYTIEIPKDAKEAGEYTGTIKGTENYTGEIPFTFKVVKVLGDVTATYDVDVEGTGDKAVYTVVPTETVRETVSNAILTRDVDYKVSYYATTAWTQGDKINVNGKTPIGGAVSTLETGKDYIAVFEGIGEYEGTAYDLLEIAPKANLASIKDATITFTKDYNPVTAFSKEYTGGQVQINTKVGSEAIAVRLNNKTLTEDVDYKVIYANNVNVSKNAQIIIVGIGDYYGTVTGSFEITQKAMTVSNIDVSTRSNGLFGIGTYCYTGKALNPTVRVQDINTAYSLVEGVDYEVSYANIVSDGSGAKKDSNGNYIKGDALNLEDITEVGSYLVVVKGIGNYTSEVTQLIKIDKVDLASGSGDVTIKGNDMVATGDEITPTFTFINKADGSEFSIDASNYALKLYADKGCTEPLDSVTEVGTYYAKLKGTNNAKGTSGAIEFNVVEGKDIADADVTVLDSTENPKLLVVLDGKVLEADTDYTVEYVVGEDGKTGTAIVTGAGKYAGTVSTTYEIKKDIVALSKASIKLSKTSYGYNGKAKKPGVTVKVDGVKVDPSEYTVSYSNNKNAGTGKVTITAKDDSEVIKGSKTMTITIAKASNKVTASNVTKSYKVKTLKAKKSTFKLSAKAKAGKISYKKVSSGKKIAVSKNGTVTVAKGLKKGTYKVKVKVTAASSTNYKAASKTMTVTVKVK